VLRVDSPSRRVSAIAGLAVAASALTKASNLPLVAAAAAVVMLKAWRLAKAGKLRAAAPRLAMVGYCVALPIGAWFIWNRFTFGDFTGSATKIDLLGWTRKPLGEWWHHPLFTPHGAWTFGAELLASFWRGEGVWHGQRLASPAADLFYGLSSVLLTGLGVISLFPKLTNATEPQRQALWFAFWSFAASVASLAVLSIAFDFGKCVYPSQVYPYFTSGRLLSGALIPFLLLYVRGLDWAISRSLRRDWPLFVVLAGAVALITISEIVVNLPVFFSEYNWFHI
jgi:hypothetical protein